VDAAAINVRKSRAQVDRIIDGYGSKPPARGAPQPFIQAYF
jgi:hypothetical protein